MAADKLILQSPLDDVRFTLSDVSHPAMMVRRWRGFATANFAVRRQFNCAHEQRSPAAQRSLGMAGRSAKPAGARMRLAPGEIALIERLVEAGALIAVPAFGSAKPHRVMTAALDPAGERILLYLSTKPTLLDGANERKPRRNTRKPAAR